MAVVASSARLLASMVPSFSTPVLRWPSLFTLALLAACGNSSPISGADGSGAPPSVPIIRTVVPLPSQIQGLLTESCTWTRDGIAILCSFNLGSAGYQVGSILPDGSRFQCITCQAGISGEPGYLYVFSDLKRFFFASQPGDAQSSGTSSGANVTPYIGECSPSLLQCTSVTIQKVSLPTILGDLNDREPRLSPDGAHYVWTAARTDGFLLLMGDLGATSNGYQVTNVRVLNAEPNPRTYDEWATRGAFTEGKSFDHGSKLIFASSRAGGVNLDDYSLDLNTGKITRLTQNLEWDEDAQFDPTSHYLILGSARRMHNQLRTMSLAAAPSFLDSSIIASVTAGVLGTDVERHHALEKWLTTPEIEAGGGDGEMLNDKTGGWASGAAKHPWNPNGSSAVWGERGPNGATRLVVVRFPTLPKQPLDCADPVNQPGCVTPTPTWAPLAIAYLPILPGIYQIPGPMAGTATLIYSGTVIGPLSEIKFSSFTLEDGRVYDGTVSLVGLSRGGLTETISQSVTISGSHSGQSTERISAQGTQVCGTVDTTLDGQHLHSNVGEWNPSCGFPTPTICPDGADSDATQSGDCGQDGLPSRFAAPLWSGN